MMSWLKEQFTIDNATKIIKLLKPEFYNKITWTTVIAGLALIGTPLLERIINAFLEQNFSLSITDNSDSKIGIVLVVIGLVYNVITVYLDKYLIQKQNIINATKVAEQDKKLFEEFLNQLPSSGSIEFLRSHSFENSFSLDELEQVRRIYYTWNGAEYEFLDAEIEALRKNLFEKIEKFIDVSSMNTYPQRNGLQWAIPDAYQGHFTYPEHVQEKIKKLNDLADEVYNAHQELVRECRQRLV